MGHQQQQLRDILHSVANRMRIDFERSRRFHHHGQAGATRETLVRNFLADYLPGNVQVVHSAEIISVSGETSAECDIVICDQSTPRLLDMEDYRIIPSECVYGVVEVKTKLNRSELLDACEKIRRVKRLPKTAYFDDGTGRQAIVRGQTVPFPPARGIIFGFESINLTTLSNHYREWCSGRPAEELPESVWILGKGSLQWTNPDERKVDTSAEYGAGLLLLDTLPDEDVLFALVVHLNILFAPAWMPPLRLGAYAGDSGLGAVKQHWPSVVARATDKLPAER